MGPIAILSALIVGLFAIVMAAFAVVALIVPVARAIGWVVGQCVRFVFSEIGDALRLVGAVLTTVVLSPMVVGSLVLGRFSAASHFGRAISSEVGTAGICLYRLALGNPLTLLGLTPLTEGLERRLPDVVRAAPGPDKPAGRRTGQFEGYTVVGSLAGGGSGGKLYVAEPDDIKRASLERQGHEGVDQVVIKAFSLKDGSTLPQIIRESRALEAAKRTGLVLDYDMTNERFFYVMRYVPGESLNLVTQRLHAQSPANGLSDRAMRQAMAYAQDVLEALDGYHSGGLWHKDIKPDNIIVHDGEAHVVDFGLVTPLRSNMTLTTHGTEYFRDPEMVRLALKGVKVHQVDGAKFDIYATGAVLFSMIENSFPAHGVLSQLSKRCPEAVKWIIRRAMADYDRRYATARQMLDDLRVVASAADPYAVKPIDLPSMQARGDGDPGPDRDELLEQAAVGAAAFAATPRPPRAGRVERPWPAAAGAPTAMRVRPSLRVVGWWSGRYEVNGVERVAATGEAAPVAAVRPLRPVGERRSAREQVAAAQQRAASVRERAQQRRAGHARRNGAAHRHHREEFRPGVNGGVLLAVGLFVLGVVGLVGLVTHGATAPRVRPVAAGPGLPMPGEAVEVRNRFDEALATGAEAVDLAELIESASLRRSEIAVGPGGAPVGATMQLAASGLAAVVDQQLRGRRVLVVSDLSRPLAAETAGRLRAMVSRLSRARMRILGDTFGALDAESPEEASELDLLADLRYLRKQRTFDSRSLDEDIGAWIANQPDVDFVVWVEPDPQQPGGALVEVFAGRERPKDLTAAFRVLSNGYVRELVKPGERLGS